MVNITKNTKNLFKMWKSCAKPVVNLGAKFVQKNVQILIGLNNLCKTSLFPHIFSHFPTPIYTTPPPLILTGFFHYSTDPTITTTNILIINN